MNWDNIDRFSLMYKILYYLVFLWLKIYYKKIVVRGLENIPKNVPVIFAPNHQNALMDAFAVLLPLNSKPVFLARADVFAGKMVTKFLKFAKIMPIYRIRDGIDTLQKNEEIFNQAIKVLENKNKLVILPEGNHSGFRRLRALKKGISRIAFQAEEKNNFKLGVNIIPVGLDYENYYKFRKTLFINYGKPFEVNQFAELYKENDQKGHKALLDELSNKLKPLMVNIENKDYYKVYDHLREIYKYQMRVNLGLKNTKQPNKLQCDQKLIATLDKQYDTDPKVFEWLQQKINAYNHNLKKFKFRDWLFNKTSYSFIKNFIRLLFLLITSPVFLYGLINNYLPFKLPDVISKKAVKDKQFLSTFNWGLGVVMFHLFYLLQFIAVWIIFKADWIKWAYLVSLPLTGLFAFWHFFQTKKCIKKIKYNRLRIIKNKTFIETKNLRQEIIDKINKIYRQFNP